jgi:hypothetical protein
MNLTDIPEYVTAKTAIDQIALPDGCSYYKRALLNDVAIESPAVVARKNELRAQYPDAYPSSHVSNGTIIFTVTANFDSRELMLAFAEHYGLTVPKECIKCGKIRDEKPTTTLIYELYQDDVKFNLSYDRDGFPTAHCKVVTNISYDIACDAGGSDSGSEE